MSVSIQMLDRGLHFPCPRCDHVVAKPAMPGRNETNFVSVSIIVNWDQKLCDNLGIWYSVVSRLRCVAISAYGSGES